jgi:hypothetical protein
MEISDVLTIVELNFIIRNVSVTREKAVVYSKTSVCYPTRTDQLTIFGLREIATRELRSVVTLSIMLAYLQRESEIDMYVREHRTEQVPQTVQSLFSM